MQLTTTQTDSHVPPTVRRIDAARALEEFTLPAMLREVVNVLGVYGVVNRDADKRDGLESMLSIALANLWVDAAEDVATLDTTTTGNRDSRSSSGSREVWSAGLHRRQLRNARLSPGSRRGWPVEQRSSRLNPPSHRLPRRRQRSRLPHCHPW